MKHFELKPDKTNLTDKDYSQISLTNLNNSIWILFVLSFCLMMHSCSSISGKPASEASTNPPNIILIIGDDHGYPYFGFMGADYVQTPHMDALASSGYVFTNAYVPDNHCRPSLQALMTGTLPIVHNKAVDSMVQSRMAAMRFDSEESRKKWEQDFRHEAMQYFETIPTLLGAKGYNSFQGGKWWEYHFRNGGFTEGMTTGWSEEDRKNGSTWFKQFMGGDGLELARATMQPVYDFIESHSGNPFFIWYAPELPHYPFDAPDKYYNIYKDTDMTESAKRYYANCTWFDDGVGALVDYLKENGLYNNVVLIYVNDNGWEQEPDQEFRHDSLRWHNGGDKGKLGINDQSFRTPIIVANENLISAGMDNETLVHSTDLFATILELAEVQDANLNDSRSLLPVIQKEARNPREEIFGKVGQMRSEEDMMGKKVQAYWIRSGDWFYSTNLTTNENYLFDVRKDPQNNKDLKEGNQELVNSFENKISEWRAKFEKE